MDEVLEQEDQLKVMMETVRGLGEGRGCFVLVGGEAGSGKTTLVRGLRERLENEVVFVLAGCEPLSVPTPLGPLRELAEAAGEPDLIGPDGNDRQVPPEDRPRAECRPSGR